MSETPPKPERSNGEIFFDALTSRTKRYDSWNDSHEWQRSGLPKTWMNWVAFGCGLGALFTCISFIPAIIFGHLGLAAAKRGEADKRGFGVTGLVIGYVYLAGFIAYIALLIGLSVTTGIDS